MKIKNTEIKLAYTLRAMIAFESITKKRFELSTITDEYVFLYCLVICNNTIDLTFEEFVSEMETNPELHHEFVEFLNRQQEKSELFADDNPTDAGKKNLA